MVWDIIIYSILLILTITNLVLTVKNSAEESSDSNMMEQVLVLVLREYVRSTGDILSEEQVINCLVNAAKREVNKGDIILDPNKNTSQNVDLCEQFARLLYKEIIQPESEETNAGNTSN